MHNSIVISLIIPMYNVEKYIARCVNSCLIQDLDKNLYEIIIIDDESKDSSLNIVEDYARIYSNIKIISQKNKGVGQSRNAGIDASSGKYIWFIDSDDYIEEHCLKYLTNECIKNDLDILDFSFIFSFDNNIQKRYIESNKKYNEVLDGINLQKNNSQYKAVWHYIYNRKFLIMNNLHFIEGVYFEDEEFLSRVLFFTKKAMSIQRSPYFYFQRENSIIHKPNHIKKRNSLLIVSESMHEFIKDNIPSNHILYKDYKNWEACLYSLALHQYQNLTQCDSKKFKSHPSYPLEFYNKNGIAKLKYRIINISPLLYISSLKLLYNYGILSKRIKTLFRS